MEVRTIVTWASLARGRASAARLVERATTAARARTAPILASFSGRRLGRRGGAVVVAAGALGLVVGAVTTAAADPQDSTRARSTVIASPTPSVGATIPPIVAPVPRTVVSVETIKTTLKPEAIEQPDKYTPAGYRKVLSTGDPGVQVATYSVTTVDGVEVDRQLLASVVEKEPTHDVVAVGTLDVPARPAIASGSNRDIGKRLAATYGWTGIEWQCLDNLWERESNWRHLIANPSSGAYGIPQALPGSKMASAGADWKTNPATQISWGLGYIKGRYGSPCGAWAAWTYRSPHWY